MDVSIRTISEPEIVADIPHIDVPLNDKGVEEGLSDFQPIDDRPEVVLEALGIQDSSVVMPSEDKANMGVVKEYVRGILRAKSLPETVGAFRTAVNDLKGEMGLTWESEPSLVLDRIAGVVKSWQKLSFIKDPVEKKRLFLSLANLKSSTEMNKKVFDYMNKYEVWQ